MNRLTRKHKPTNYTRYTEKTICLKNYNIRNANLNKAIEKLGQLEDLIEKHDIDSIEELERKINKKSFVVFAGGRHSGKTLMTKGLLYERLSEKLGCPLEVVFKALKEGIYKKDEDILFEATLRIHDNEIYLCQPYDDKLLHKVLVKDYGKTWLLKGEKEND